MSIKGRVLEAGWKKFESLVIPKHAGWTQRRDMRQAFMAGAWLVLEVSLELGKDSVSEEDGLVVLESLHAECEAFGVANRAKLGT